MSNTVMRDGYGLGIGSLMSRIMSLHALLVLARAMRWSVPLGDWDLELGC